MQPTGHKTWKVIYSLHGRPRWYSLGAADAIGLADARKLAGRVMFQVAEGKDPAAERKADRSKGTFEELAARYVEEYAKRNNKSLEASRYAGPQISDPAVGQAASRRHFAGRCQAP